MAHIPTLGHLEPWGLRRKLQHRLGFRLKWKLNNLPPKTIVEHAEGGVAEHWFGH